MITCCPLISRKAARHEIGVLPRIQENFWRRKACDDTIKLGDNNTRYFFHKATRKHKVRAVRRIVTEQGELVVGVENVANVFQVEWSNLLNSNRFGGAQSSLPRSMSINKVISLEANVKLLCLPCMEEIDGVVQNMKKWKAPEPDGFPEEFYQT